MVEWSITAVLKTAVPRGTGGSNPSLSASHQRNGFTVALILVYNISKEDVSKYKIGFDTPSCLLQFVEIS